MPEKPDHNAIRKNIAGPLPVAPVADEAGDDRLAWWVEQYLAHAVTTAPSSRAVQRRDLAAFVRFAEEAGAAARSGCTCMVWAWLRKRRIRPS